MPAVIARFLLSCGALFVFASVALAEGVYQQTKDGKTTLWNNHPTPGEVAAWWGDRDHDGYASGVGTLTWYGATGTVYARYFGNMVRGKFHGPVNAHSKGKTAYAMFVDGRRTTGWTAGSAPSRRVVVQPSAPAGEKRAEIAKREKPPSPSVERRTHSAGSGQTNAEHRKEDIPAEGPRDAVRHGENVSHATANSEGVHEHGAQRPTEDSPPDGPSVVVKGPPNKPVPPPPSSSLQKLAAPPPSLGMNPIGEASPAEQTASARLTKREVIDLADAKAHSRGYDPAEYQRPEPQYDPADNTWSLLYEQKSDGMVDIGNHFSVAVDDKTKKTSIVPGR